MEGLFKLGINWATLIAQLVNFTVLFVLLYMFAYKPILKMLDSRSKKIEESAEQAESIKQQLAHTEEESKRRIEAASQEGHEIVAKAVRSGEEARQLAKQDAQKEADALVARARADIQRERDEAIGGLRREFADLTILAAEKVIEKSLDKETHRQLIDKTLAESPTFRKR